MASKENKKKEESSSAGSWIPNIIKFISDLIETLVFHSNNQVEELKKKAVHYIIVYGLFFTALFFIIIGLIKYLVEIKFFYSEGIAFMVSGSIMIVLLATYSMFKRI